MLSLVRFTAALFAAAIVSSAAFAASNEPPATPAMWRVADADSEFILLGSFHILPKGLEWRSPALNDAFKRADTIYFEMEGDAPEIQSTTVRIMMTEGFNSPGTTLTQMLSTAEGQKLREITKKLNLPFAAIDPMRPWQAFLTLSVQLIVQKGFEPGAGVDTVLLSEARTFGKELKFFETLEQQLGFFTGFSPETEKMLLVMTIEDWDHEESAFDALFTAWKTGDMAYIDQEMNVSMRDQAPEVFETLIVNRNQAWAKKLASDIRNSAGNALVVVGAGHLAGNEYSVPALLKAEGFEVSRYGVEAAANDNQQSAAEDALGDFLKAVE